MARSVYYYHTGRKRGAYKYARAEEEISSIFHEHKGRYGYRRVTAEMRDRGYGLNNKTVRRLMAGLGLKCELRPKKYRSYRGGVSGKASPNILNRDFSTSAPNRKWVTDVTQMNVCGRRLFLSPVIDLFNGEVVSYDLSTRADMAQVRNMLGKAFERNGVVEGIILHSDQGWQYRSRFYREELRKHGVVQSMSRKGNCLDNAVAENFFGIMKSELLYAEEFKTTEAFIKALHEYIDYYNNVRIKSRLGMSPVKYRELAQSQLNV